MSVERLLPCSFAWLSLLSALLLGLGLESVWTPGVLAAAAVVSLLLTDLLGWIRLRRAAVELAALAAVLLALFRILSLTDYSSWSRFVHDYGVNQLRVLARLLVFLHVLSLFQLKDNRVYWRLLLLSFLEAVAATALILQVEFGLLLLAYAASALLSGTLFFWRRCAERLGQAPAILVLGEAAAAPPARPPARLPLGQYLRHSLAVAVAAAVFAAAFFCASPRSAVSHTTVRVERQIGFTREIILGSMAGALQNDSPVLRVSFRRAATGAPFRWRGEPYFRGVVLSDYVSSERADAGRWLALRNPLIGARRLAAPPAEKRRRVVIQEAASESSERIELMAVSPVFAAPGASAQLRWQPGTGVLSRRVAGAGAPHPAFRYAVATLCTAAGRPLPAVPAAAPEPDDRLRDRAQWLAVDVERQPTVRLLAERVLRDAGLEHAEAWRRAKALERHFRTSPEYTYSLDNHALRTLGLDPIEDFLANHRTGHCEYFASALALMLRSQDIPSRLVVGFVGGEYNSVGQFYLLRQLDAHAWVEAFLAPDELPPELAGDPLYRHGAWLRLDPTPASGRRRQAELIDQSLDMAEVLWKDYVLAMDAEQQGSLVEPLLRGAASLYQLIASRTLLLNLADWLAQQAPAAGAAIGLLCGLAAAGIGLRRRWKTRVANRRRPPPPRYYRRLLRLLAREGLRPQPAQTAREFALQAQTTLLGRGLPPEAALVPVQAVDAYYRLRFGRMPLSEDEQQQLRRAVRRMAGALAVRRNGRPR